MSLPSTLAGLALRFWAMGYIGVAARSRDIAVPQQVVSGPYRWLRHPLYVGNALIVAGVLVMMWPPAWMAVTVFIGFLVEYCLIARAEGRELAAARMASPSSTASFRPGLAVLEWQTLLQVAALYGFSLVRLVMARR